MRRVLLSLRPRHQVTRPIRTANPVANIDAHPDQWREQQRRWYVANRERLLAKKRARRAAAKLARTISTALPAVFRLALPLPDLAEFAHLVGIVPELLPDGLSAPGP